MQSPDMYVCQKCSRKVIKVYDCEHTDDLEYCKECYMDLHYYITESDNS